MYSTIYGLIQVEENVNFKGFANHVYRLRHKQYGYRGHVTNLLQDTASFANSSFTFTILARLARRQCPAFARMHVSFLVYIMRKRGRPGRARCGAIPRKILIREDRCSRPPPAPPPPPPHLGHKSTSTLAALPGEAGVVWARDYNPKPASHG